jgi:protein subunit release factor A
MKVLLEIRPGEGGQDARLLVQNQAAIYIRFAETHGLAVEVEEQDSL